MAAYNILLVEDDVIDVITVDRAFAKANISNPLYKAKNGEEALDFLLGTNGKPKIKKPFLVLLDLNMPKMSGLEFLETLRNNEELKSTTVVVLTSSMNDEDVIKAYNFQVAGYLTKPVGMEKIVEKLAALGKYWTLCELEG